MKNYIQLYINAQAYYSGNTYYEEVFLTKEMWDSIKDKISMYTYLYEFDGKHSEVKVEIYQDEVSEEYLKSRVPLENDGERLDEYIYDRLDEVVEDELYELQQYIKSLSEVEELTIRIKSSDKEKVLELLKDFI